MIIKFNSIKERNDFLDEEFPERQPHNQGVFPGSFTVDGGVITVDGLKVAVGDQWVDNTST